MNGPTVSEPHCHLFSMNFIFLPENYRGHLEPPGISISWEIIIILQALYKPLFPGPSCHGKRLHVPFLKERRTISVHTDVWWWPCRAVPQEHLASLLFKGFRSENQEGLQLSSL